MGRGSAPLGHQQSEVPCTNHSPEAQLMHQHQHQPQDQTAIRTDLGAIFVSLELSRSTWLITSLSPGDGERLSKHLVSAGDIGGLLALVAQLQQKAAARLDRSFRSSRSKRPAWTGSGSIGFWIAKGLKAMSSTRRRS